MPSSIYKNRVYLNEFDESVDEIMLDFIELVHKEAFEKIRIYINSEGGDSTRAFALVSLIEQARVKGITVETFVLHDAHSSGSLVAVSGTPGHRFVSHRGSYLLHYGEVEVVARGPVEAKRIYDANWRHFQQVRDVYAKNTQMRPESLDNALSQDNFYLPADLAIEYGFADGYL